MFGSTDMKKLERVQSITYRRMSHIDSELERLEERPEPDMHGRYGRLRRRFEELEKLYYKLRRLDAPDPRRTMQRLFAEHAARMGKSHVSVLPLSVASHRSKPARTTPYDGIF